MGFLVPLQILTTLLRAGFAPSQLACDELNKMAEILEGSFQKEGGVIGYGECSFYISCDLGMEL